MTATFPTRATRSIDEVASVLGPHTATHDAACTCAAEVLRRLRGRLRRLVRRARADPPDRPTSLAATLTAMFDADVDLSAASCAAVIDADLRAAARGRARASTSPRSPGVATSSSASRTPGARGPTPTRPSTGREERLQDTVLELLSAGATCRSPTVPALCALRRHDPRRRSARTSASGSTPTSPPAHRLDELTDFDPPNPASVRRGQPSRRTWPRRSGTCCVQRYATVHRGVVPPLRAGARSRRPAQHLPASDPPRLRRGLRLQPRPARTDGTWEQLTWTPRKRTYPVFEANQVLTNAHLNDLFEYLDEQTRLTRANLIGIGIACGLEREVRGARHGAPVARAAGSRRRAT